MADYTVSTNILSWLLIEQGMFGWPQDTATAQVIGGMLPGDLIVPKFAQSASYSPGSFEAYQRRVAEVFGADHDPALERYEAAVRGGEAAVPFVLQVTGMPFERSGSEVPNPSVGWTCVDVQRIDLAYPISTSEFLRLRVVPVAVGIQFKASVAKGRHVQALGPGAGEAVIAIGNVEHRGKDELRTESLVRASSVEGAANALETAGLAPRRLDRAFVFDETRILGLCDCEHDGSLVQVGESIERAPETLRALFLDAKRRSPKFTVQRALHGADQLEAMFASGEQVAVLDELGRFHDRYVLLPSKVNAALDITATHPPLSDSEPEAAAEDIGDPEEESEASAEELTLEQIEGLSVSALRAKLPSGVVLDDAVLAETVTALRAGKHLILSGPPGTGKSTLAAAICEAAGADFRTATATADWSTVDTIGAYLPAPAGGLEFHEGVVLAAFDGGQWLIIDELNRADIDKAFGPLFTLLAGAGGDGAQTVSLPYRDAAGKRIQIGWAQNYAQATTKYAVTASWRLIGTMNDSDRASLFGLSFAFLRRFAVIDVDLPDEASYRELLRRRLPSAAEHMPEELVEVAIRVAQLPIRLGPAIMLDVAEFTRRGVTTTASGTPPYSSARAALLTALRLYVVPQYEGAEHVEVERLLGTVSDVFGDPPAEAWKRLKDAAGRAAIGG